MQRECGIAAPCTTDLPIASPFATISGKQENGALFCQAKIVLAGQLQWQLEYGAWKVMSQNIDVALSFRDPFAEEGP